MNHFVSKPSVSKFMFTGSVWSKDRMSSTKSPISIISNDAIYARTLNTWPAFAGIFASNSGKMTMIYKALIIPNNELKLAPSKALMTRTEKVPE